MAVNKDKNQLHNGFAVIMVLVVGTLLAGFSSGLKPRLRQTKSLKSNKTSCMLWV